MLEGIGMMQTAITWSLTVSLKENPPQGAEAARRLIEHHLDQVMEELLKLEACNHSVHDPALSVDLSTLPHAMVEVELLVDGVGAEAHTTGQSVLRTAIHSAGGCTPSEDWDAPNKINAVYEVLHVELAPV